MQSDITWVPFGDVSALDAAVARHATELAAVILEPLVHDIAPVDWLQAARHGCDRSGAVLVFDEIKTAFRIRTGGVQELLGVLPDLTTIGKAMANGYPMAAVAGRAGIMEHATRTWISSTAATESTGLAATQAVCDWHDRVDVPARMADAGGMLLDIIGGALSDAPWVGVRAEGPPAMWRLVGDSMESLDALVAASAHAGVLLKRGAYQFGAVAHDQSAMDVVVKAMPAVMQALMPGPRRTEE
jgi:glutamate-1-semialdehyde aminotransferase